MMKQEIYLNYAATNNRLFVETQQVLCDYIMKNNNTNMNRGVSDKNILTNLFKARNLLADFFHAEHSSHVIFTSNATTSLNMILNGLLEENDHVITTSVEHNAVSRPLQLLISKKNISVTYAMCESDGILAVERVKKAILPETKVLVMTHASNVLGTILPIKECFQYAKSKGIITVLDSAQTAGFLPINMKDMCIDVLAFTGHKGLRALSGIGGFVLTEFSAKEMKPWLVGGTGSFSRLLEQPSCLPDKFEAGTPNILGILSLHSSIKKISEIGLLAIQKHEQKLLNYFFNELAQLPLKVLGTKKVHLSVPVVSIHVPNWDSGELSQALYDQYQIITRSGLHCAPLAHQTAGTLSLGAVRFSFGLQTTIKELDYTIESLKQLLMK